MVFDVWCHRKRIADPVVTTQPLYKDESARKSGRPPDKIYHTSYDAKKGQALSINHPPGHPCNHCEKRPMAFYSQSSNQPTNNQQVVVVYPEQRRQQRAEELAAAYCCCCGEMTCCVYCCLCIVICCCIDVDCGCDSDCCDSECCELLCCCC